MHKTTLFAFCLFLIAAPVFAQTPSPILPSPDALDRLLTFVGNVGAPWSVIIFAIFALWKLGKPISDAAVKLLDTAWKAMDRIAQSGEAMTVTMTTVETKEQADEGRKHTVTAVNTHTDEKVDPVVGELKTLSARVDKLATKEEVAGDMTEIRTQLHKIISELEGRKMPASLAPVTPAPSGDGNHATPMTEASEG